MARKAQPSSPTTALGRSLSDAPRRPREALERQRDELVRKIGAKKKEVARLERAVEEAEAIVSERLAPLVERSRHLDSEVHSLFQRLAATRKSAREQRAIRAVWQALIDEEIITAPPRTADAEEVEFGAGSAWDDDGEGEAVPPSSGQRGVASDAPQQSLKSLFKRLTLALHPDRVQDDEEKERRTTAMKGVVRAYEQGDLAGLMQIETNLEAAGELNPGDESARVAALERVVEELRRQLLGLRRSARELRGADALHLLEPPAGRRTRRSNLDRLAEQVQSELDAVVRIRDFVRAFLAGHVAFAEFLIGPSIELGDTVFDFDDLVERARRRNQRARRRRR